MVASLQYKLADLIQQGSAVRTYRARRNPDGARLVVKVAVAPEGASRLRHEHGILSALGGDGVAIVLALEEKEGATALILEDSGDSLATLGVAGTMSIEAFLCLAERLTLIVENVHARGVVHKDINPSNIVSRDGMREITLVDFSLATMLTEQTVPFLPLRQLEGTLAYMSPEQTGRMNRPIDDRTDHYALGATFYELLTGRPPFIAMDALELLHAHLALEPLPPHAIDARVPPELSAVVLKLLSKNPEDRYQSMSGLRTDLEACRRRIGGGTATPFLAGTGDHPVRFHVPQKLYGREEERGALLAAFERACGGSGGMLAIAGPSGIGKSALVHDVLGLLTRHRGYFIDGKLDQYARGTPYRGLVQAMERLVQQMLAEDDSVLAGLRAAFDDAVGDEAMLLVNACPALHHVVTPRSREYTLSPNETRDRLHRAMRKLLLTVASAERPLCVFIDDVQWTDADSLDALEEIASSLRESHVLFIVAYRDDDTEASRTVLATLDRIAEAGGRVDRIGLGPLGEDDIDSLLADLSMAPGDERRMLSQLTLSRTGGNPFFVRSFIEALHEKGWLWLEEGRLEVDAAKVRLSEATDNVVDLLIERARGLPPRSQEILTYAACLGISEDLGTLAVAAFAPLEEVAGALWEAIAANLVLVVDPIHSLIEMVARGAQVRFRFTHDRVQQAALSLVEAETAPKLHRAAGRRLLGLIGGDLADPRLFDVVGQLNLGRAAVSEPAEMTELAGLNLCAAQKALRLAAAQQALGYARAGIEATEAMSAGAEDGSLASELHLVGAEAAFLIGDLDVARSLCEKVVGRPSSDLQGLRGRRLEGQILYSRGEIAGAIGTYREGLKVAGVMLPDVVTPAVLGEERRMTREAIDHDIALSAPPPRCKDSLAVAAMRILSDLVQTTASSATDFHPIVTCRLVRMSVERGHTSGSAFGYVQYGLLLMRDGDVGRALAMCRRGVELAEEYGDKGALSTIYAYAYFHVLHVEMRIEDICKRFFDGYRYALDGGNPFMAAASAMTLCGTRFIAGHELGNLGAEMDRYAEVIAGLRQTMLLGWHQIFRQTVMNLKGDNERPFDLAGPAYDERVSPSQQRAANDAGGLFDYHLCKAFLLYLFGETSALQPVLSEGVQYSIVGTTSAFAGLWLLLTGLGRLAVPEPDAATLVEVDAAIRQLRSWAAHGPAVFEHRAVLIEAERARVIGPGEEAVGLYENAVLLAAKSELPHEHGIACEVAARFFLGRGDRIRAGAYMRDAHRAYLRWGAIAKVRQIERQYPYLVSRVATGAPGAATLHAVAGIGRGLDAIDIVGVLNASQAISGEIDLHGLLDRLMRVLMETSGAEMGAILRERDGGWMVEAQRTADSEHAVLEPVLLEDLGAAGRRLVPRTVVQLVAHTLKPVLRDDASSLGELSRDPVVAKRGIRSILCFPLLRQGSLSGVVYLENSLLAGAFAEDRVPLLELLAGQAVISIENATLYGTLEQKVKDRTLELSEKNAMLAKAIQQLRETQDRLIVQDRLASLGSMVAGLAHELRNPLNFVSNFAELSVMLVAGVKKQVGAAIARTGGDLVEVEGLLGKLTVNLDRIREHSRRMDGVVRSMLEHSRSGAGAREITDFNRLVQKFATLSVDAFRARAPSFDVDLVLDLDPLMGTVNVVPQEMTRLLLNLVDNALYATKVKHDQLGDSYRPILVIGTSRHGETVELRVQDNGTGIANEVVERIFEPFFTTKRPGEGTGLGLSICHDILQKGYGGSLTVRTVPGEQTEMVASFQSK